MRRTILPVIKYSAAACLLFLAAAPAAAVVKSTFSFNSGMNCGKWYLPDTGQTQCYDTQTTPVSGACPGGGNGTGPAGQDGSYAPAASQPAYAVYYGGVETSSYTVDNVTGLMWVTNPDDACSGCSGGYVSSGTYTWENALARCEGLSYAGYSDWRLPNVRELESIVDHGTTAAPRIDKTYFLNTQTSVYCTGTTRAAITTDAFYITFFTGTVSIYEKSFSSYVRCVRGGPY